MREKAQRWMLAFDASCGRCQNVARVVDAATDGRLDVRPLTDPDVRTWRERALGPRPPWAPTLIRLHGDSVSAWTGVRMGVALARRLGPRSTVRLLRALGELRTRPSTATGSDTLSRKDFLKLGAGVGVAAGLVLAGKSPAAAAEIPYPLPHRYDDFVRYTMPQRQAIFGKLSGEARSRLWTEHLSRYVAAHPRLSASQLRVVQQAKTVVGSPATFARRRTPQVDRQLSALREDAIAVFGRDEARRLVATLGPAEDAAIPGCSCSLQSDWCVGYCTGRHNCIPTPAGCGTLLAYPCVGTCVGGA